MGFDLGSEPGHLVVNQVEAQLVREIFELFIEKQSLVETAQELTRRGLHLKKWVTREGRAYGGGTFDGYNLKRLLTNRAYRGQVLFDGIVYDGQHEAILDQEHWDCVQDLLGENAGGRPPHRSTRSSHLLTGLLRCGPCNSAMTPCYSARGARRYTYYRCSKAYKRGAASCPSKSIPACEVEAFVVDRIKIIGRDPELIAATTEQAREQLAARRRELEVEIRNTQKTLDTAHLAARAQIADAGNSRPGRVLDTAPAADVVALEDRLAGLREEQAALHGLRIDPNDLRTALANFDDVWANLTSVERQRVVRLLIREVSYDGGTGKLKITFSPDGVRLLAAESVAPPEATR